MTEAEKLLAEIDSPKLGDKTELNANREKAAKQWLNHFFSISKYIEDAKEQGVVLTTEAELVTYIVSVWETSSETKDSQVTKLFAA